MNQVYSIARYIIVDLLTKCVMLGLAKVVCILPKILQLISAIYCNILQQIFQLLSSQIVLPVFKKVCDAWADQRLCVICPGSFCALHWICCLPHCLGPAWHVLQIQIQIQKLTQIQMQTQKQMQREHKLIIRRKLIYPPLRRNNTGSG